MVKLKNNEAIFWIASFYPLYHNFCIFVAPKNTMTKVSFKTETGKILTLFPENMFDRIDNNILLN